MLGYKHIKKIVVRYGCEYEESKTKDVDISYILDSDIDMDFPVLTLYEILKQMRENNKLELPEEIIVTVNIEIKEKLIPYCDKYNVERMIVKKITEGYSNISDLSIFLYNLEYHIQELEAHENIMADGITYLKKYDDKED